MSRDEHGLVSVNARLHYIEGVSVVIMDSIRRSGDDALSTMSPGSVDLVHGLVQCDGGAWAKRKRA